jgi:hypothetical protein
MDESTDALLSVCDQAIQRANRILKGDHRALSGYETLRDRALGLRPFGFATAIRGASEIGAALIVAMGGSWPSAALAARTVDDLEKLGARRRVLMAIRDSEAAQRNALLPPVVPKAGTAPTDPWARFAGRSATKENFLRLVSVDPRDIRSTIARTQKVAWSNYVSNRVVPTHKPNKRGLHGLYPVRDLLAEFQRLAWPVKPSTKIDAVERWTVASDAPKTGYTLNRRNQVPRNFDQ